MRGVVVGLARIVAVEGRDRIGERSDQLILDALVDDHIVRSDAGLTGVEELRPGDPLGGHLDVGVGGDDGGALASELEGDRREVLGRRPHHDATDLAITGVEDVVEVLFEQRRGFVDGAGDDGHRGCVEVLGNQFLDERRHRGRDLRRLQHGGVARSEGRHERAEQQLHRVVPGSDDADRAECLGPQGCLARLERQRNLHLGRLGPRVEVLKRVVDLVDRERDFGGVGLDAWLADVGNQCIDQMILLLDEQRAKLLQLASS